MLLSAAKWAEAGATADSMNARGMTPLMLASSSNGKDAMEVLRLLLEKASDMMTKDKNGWNCLHHACRNGKTEVVKHLLSLKHDPTTMTNDHKTTLMLAALEGKYEIVRKLAEDEKVRAQATQKDALGVSALHCAGKEGSPEITKLLLESSARANATDIEGKTPLMWACEHGNLECAKAIVKRGGDINGRDKTERTPLWFACMSSYEDIALWLFKKLGDPNFRDIVGESPLMIAEELGLNKFKSEIKLGGATDDLADI